MEADSFPRHVDVESGVMAPDILMLALTLILLMWRIGWAPNNARKWQVGFKSAFKGLSSGIQATVVLPQLLVVLGVIFDDVFSY